MNDLKTLFHCHYVLIDYAEAEGHALIREHSAENHCRSLQRTETALAADVHDGMLPQRAPLP